MQKVHANKIVSLTEIRNSKKFIAEAGSDPVAVMNRNKVVGYFIPVAFVVKHDIQNLEPDSLRTYLSDVAEKVKR